MGNYKILLGKMGLIGNKILKGHILFSISSIMQMSIFFSSFLFVKGKCMTKNLVYTKLLHQE